MKKVYGYCRVSTMGQAIDGESLAVQEEKIISYCKIKNLNLIKTFVEEGVSGAIDLRDRPQFKLLLDGINSNNACGIVVTKIDRLSRSTKDFVNFMADIKDKYDFFCLQNDIDTSSPQGKFSMVLMSAIAELEKDMTSVRVKEVIASKRNKGERIGTIPFGKKLVDGTNLLEDNPEEQRTINIAKDYRKSFVEIDGKKKYMTHKQICEELIKLGRKNKDGEVKWFPSQIRRMLNDGVYVINKGKNSKRDKL